MLQIKGRLVYVRPGSSPKVMLLHISSRYFFRFLFIFFVSFAIWYRLVRVFAVLVNVTYPVPLEGCSVNMTFPGYLHVYFC